MTIREAVERKISRVRKPIWGFDNAYLKLDLLNNGGRGPWAKLYSRTEQEIIQQPTPQGFILLSDSDADWEEYKGEIDREDTE